MVAGRRVTALGSFKLDDHQHCQRLSWSELAVVMRQNERYGRHADDVGSRLTSPV